MLKHTMYQERKETLKEKQLIMIAIVRLLCVPMASSGAAGQTQSCHFAGAVKVIQAATGKIVCNVCWLRQCGRTARASLPLIDLS